MQTTLSDQARRLPRATEAESVLRACVHCGFCNATCPTYQLRHDERDGPRGRIYLTKQVLEGHAATIETQRHLDRCLGCRTCESTCPSGVNYHALLDIGREVVDAQVARPLRQRLFRRALRAVLVRPRVFGMLATLGSSVRPVLPAALAAKLPRRRIAAGVRPAPRHARRMILPEGCVQPSLSPNTNAAAARVLDRLGITVAAVPDTGCCGAIDYHLDAQAAGLARARRAIDAWWPAIASGAESVVITASGCGAFVREYAHLLRDDPAYADKARAVVERVRDLVEVLRDAPLETLARAGDAPRVAVHDPCSLRHAQKLGGQVATVLSRVGVPLAPVTAPPHCCGSAGTYSIMQPQLSRELRDRALESLEQSAPDVVATANIGCQVHLDGAGRTPVRHWIELVDEVLSR